MHNKQNIFLKKPYTKKLPSKRMIKVFALTLQKLCTLVKLTGEKLSPLPPSPQPLFLLSSQGVKWKNKEG